MLPHMHANPGRSAVASSATSAIHLRSYVLLHCSNPWLCRVDSRTCQHYQKLTSSRCSRKVLVQSAAGTPSDLSLQEAAQDEVLQGFSAVQPDAHEALADRLHGCPVCISAGRVPCKECEGRGFLKRGGYMKKNPLNMSRIIGSKWTAMEETMGWRHFRVIQQRKLDKHTPFLLLQASCDHSVQLWVNAQTLRDRSAWAAGWLQMSEIQGIGLEIQGSRGLKCQACSGLGYKPCISCEGTGRAHLIVL